MTCSRRFLSIDWGWPNHNVASPSRRTDAYRSGTLSCLALCLRRKSAFQKMLPSLAKADLAYILLRSGRELGCGLSSLQRPRTSSGLGRSTDARRAKVLTLDALRTLNKKPIERQKATNWNSRPSRMGCTIEAPPPSPSAQMPFSRYLSGGQRSAIRAL